MIEMNAGWASTCHVKDLDIFLDTDDVRCSCANPIVCDGVVRIGGSSRYTLELISNDYQQPVIGLPTNTGMSFGRWSPASGDCVEEIIIDTVCVKLRGTVPNFTLGIYGKNNLPKITLLNGGTLECPETEGERVMLHTPTQPQGSTKFSDTPVYAIKKEGQSDLDLLEDDVRSKYIGLIAKYSDAKIPESYCWNIKSLYSAESVLKAKPFADCSAFLRTNYIDRAMAASLLNLDENDTLDDEFMFMLEKIESVVNELFFGKQNVHVDEKDAHDYLVIYNKIMLLLYKYHEEMSRVDSSVDDGILKVLYAMIPEYRYDWSGARKRGLSDEMMPADYLSSIPEKLNANTVTFMHITVTAKDVYKYFLTNNGCSNILSIADF